MREDESVPMRAAAGNDRKQVPRCKLATVRQSLGLVLRGRVHAAIEILLIAGRASGAMRGSCQPEQHRTETARRARLQRR